MEEAELITYRRSWDAFIEAYGDLLNQKEKEPLIVEEFGTLMCWALAFETRLAKVSRTKVDKELIEGFNKWLKSLPQTVSVS